MNVRKIAALATVATLLCPAIAFAGATTKTGTVTVKWNSQALAALTLHTDYNSSGAFNGGTAAGKIDTNANGGSGTCTAADPTNTDGTDDFGTVSVDATKYTDCQYESAINAIVSTSSSNWNVTEALSANPPAGYELCAYANNGTKSFASFNAAALPVTTTSYGGAATSNTSTASCASNGQALSTTAFTASTNTNQFTAASPANIGEDLELVMANNAASGATSVTLTYTLTAN